MQGPYIEFFETGCPALKQRFFIGTVLTPANVEQQLLCRGNPGQDANAGTIQNCPGKHTKKRDQEHRRAGQLVQPGVDRREPLKFHRRRNVRGKPQRQNRSHHVPDPGWKQAPHDRKQFDQHDQIEQQVGNTVQPGPKLRGAVWSPWRSIRPVSSLRPQRV